MRIAIVAGEASGDFLGGAIIRALKARLPDATFYGVAGPRMRDAGCEAVESIEALSVMGLAEVLRHLPRLMNLHRALVDRFLTDHPDLFIGIDAPDFNIPMERKLRDGGIKTAHVVSPSVWAWRQGRIKKIRRAVDLMLCLLPFEEAFYREHRVRAVYMGHPMADELDASVSPQEARARLGLPATEPVVAILPGSRHFELNYLSEPFTGAAAWLAWRVPDCHFVVPIAHPDLKPTFQEAMRAHAPDLRWHLLDGQARLAMQAADAVLVASGTATLECLLAGRPMVVAYRGNAITAFVMRRLKLMKVAHVSLPNLLTPQARVPEMLQEAATAEHLGKELWALLKHPVLRELQLEQFDAVRGELKRGAAGRAADAICDLLGKRAADA